MHQACTMHQAVLTLHNFTFEGHHYLHHFAEENRACKKETVPGCPEVLSRAVRPSYNRRKHQSQGLAPWVAGRER